MAVAEIQAEEIGVGALIRQRTWWIAASDAARRRRLALRSTPWTIAVEPMADGISGQPESFADLTEGDAFGAEPQCLFVNVGPVHALIFEQGYDSFPWCRGRDSNPHVLSDK